MHGETMLHYLDTQYAYQLAKRMEAIRSNPVLGYRTAGSKAERRPTGGGNAPDWSAKRSQG